MLLKISKFLNNIAFKIRQKALYFELKYYIKQNSTYIKPISYYTRGIGKTHTLIQLAKKYKCPIAVPNQRMAKYIKGECKYKKIKSPELIICDNSMRGKRLELVLCEEGINNEYINQILKPISNCVVGYYNYDMDYYNIKKHSNNEIKFQTEYKCEWIGKEDDKQL